MTRSGKGLRALFVFVSVVASLVFALLVSGCSGMSVVGYPIEGGKAIVQRTVSDPHAFAPTTQRSWMELCDRIVEKKKYGSGAVDEEERFVNCVRDGNVQFTTTNGYMDGLGAAMLYSGAIVGGAALIGAGIADSGTTVNQLGGGATQQQYQYQWQQQNQSQGNIRGR